MVYGDPLGLNGPLIRYKRALFRSETTLSRSEVLTGPLLGPRGPSRSERALSKSKQEVSP